MKCKVCGFEGEFTRMRLALYAGHLPPTAGHPSIVAEACPECKVMYLGTL